MRWREAKKKGSAKEPVAPSWQSAPLLPRFKAFIVDSFMVLMPILYTVFYLIFGSREGFSAHRLEGWIYVLGAYFLITALFFSRKGQTPGYKAYELILIDTRTHTYPSWSILLQRFILLCLSAITLLGLLVPLFRRDRLGVYDLLSHTATVTK